MKRVVVASGNAGKLGEIRAALPAWEFVTVTELGGWKAPAETGTAFEENARIKARAAHEQFGMAALADDSGLEVDALDGEPGVRSARYAGESASDAQNNAKLLGKMVWEPESARTARFRCVIVLVDEDGTETVATGTCEGSVAQAPRGTGGFGYDPLFLPDAAPGLTMAELDVETKNVISHRGAALRALREALGGASG